MMAKRKNLQQRVVEEVDRLQDFSKESLESMTFTFMVLRETLRLYPTVLFLSRETDSDELVLPSGHIIPPHTHVEVSPLLLHRSSTYWDEPLEFRPERFAPGGEASLPKAKNAFIPFSSGPRSCIGKLFFQYESRTIICHIFKRFTLELVEHEENGALESSDGLMKPKKVWIRLKKRK
ncbi:cytochrome P450 [Paraphysoderma sedebokerense]|nr:cytochrome P450 [Paraphysoderma sedebokerense]